MRVIQLKNRMGGYRFEAGRDAAAGDVHIPDSETHHCTKHVQHDRGRSYQSLDRIDHGFDQPGWSDGFKWTGGPADRHRETNRFDGLVAERDVVRLWFACVGVDEREEAGGARVALASAPDAIRIRGDVNQLGNVLCHRAVVHRPIEQPCPTGAAVGIIEDCEAGEMRVAAAREVDARLPGARQRPPALDVVANRAEHRSQRIFFARPDRGEHRQATWSHERLATRYARSGAT